jgi:hydroxyethylthiazole kinase-like uncharacterized protein yjeF
MTTPLYRTAELRALEQRAAQGLPAGTLMARAGAAAAAFIAHRWPQAQRVLVLCGPGNNGGDGYVCATELARAGKDATCVALAAPAADDARDAARRWTGATPTALPIDQHFDLLVDAMFGIGLVRPLSGVFLDAARWLASQPQPRVALDVPSGLDADTGAWVGGVAGAEVDATLTLLAGKPGLFTGDGVDACGDVLIEPLGVEAPAAAVALNAPDQFAAVARRRRRNSHKGRFGDVVVIGGNVGMPGAALLAARAALRLGAGRVYVDCVGGELHADPLAPELMFRRAAEVAGPQVTVIGCGLGTDDLARSHLRSALASTQPVVIDADALNLLAGNPQAAMYASALRVLTPHPLEAARLLGSTAADVQADRLAAAAALAARFNAWIVLKGAGSVIAAPDGRLWINPTGSPALATPGSGDVLAGMFGALLAQGFDAQSAVLAAVWLHGRAAEDFGADVGLVAGEVAPLAARALGRLRGYARIGAVSG